MTTRPIQVFALALAGLAMLLAAGPASAGGGSCCSSNGTPGCQSSSCETLVCGFDPFCCNTEWDQNCATAANLVCSVCGSSCGAASAGSCCEDNGSPGCDTLSCCSVVCLSFAFCCESDWDSICAQIAAQECLECRAEEMIACCFPNDSCSELTGQECNEAGGEPNGIGGCSKVACTTRQFACCFPNGSCTNLFFIDCAILGGIPHQGVLCAQVECPPSSLGACCVAFTPCFVGTPSQCTFGTFFPGVSCDDVFCEPAGACCLPRGGCEAQVAAVDCMVIGGAYQGDYTACRDALCAPPLGACCLQDQCFDFFTEENCLQLGGGYQGDISICADISCESPGACCLPTGICLIDLPSDCLTQGGTPFPSGCLPGLCSPCPTDTDGNGATDAADLVNIILAWNTTDPDADVDDNGIVNVQDLVLVITNWGACP